MMNAIEIEIALAIAEKLRDDLNLSKRSHAFKKIEKWMLTAFAEGFRAGYWSEYETR